MAIDADTLVSIADFKVYAGITTAADDVIIQQTLDRASAVACSYCGRKFVQQNFLEIRDTFGNRRLALKQSPISVVRFVGVGWDNVVAVDSTIASDAFASISVDDAHVHLYRVDSNGGAHQTTISLNSHNTSTEIATQITSTTGFRGSATLNVPAKYIRRLAGRDLRNSTAYLEAPTESVYDYQVDLATGVLYGGQLHLYRSMLIDYTGGYSAIPLDVQQAVMMIAQRIYHGRKRDMGVGSESLGGYSYSLRGSAEIDMEAKMLLDPYRRLR